MVDEPGKQPKPIGKISVDERAEFERRLSDLDDRLDNAQGAAKVEENADGRGKAVGYGLRMATDIIAAILVGAAIGWYLDQWLGTQPIFLLIFIALGLAAAARNVIQTYRVMAADYGTDTGQDTDDLSKPVKNADEDD